MSFHTHFSNSPPPQKKTPTNFSGISIFFFTKILYAFFIFYVCDTSPACLSSYLFTLKYPANDRNNKIF
jgi:hypothetical protein